MTRALAPAALFSVSIRLRGQLGSSTGQGTILLQESIAPEGIPTNPGLGEGIDPLTLTFYWKRRIVT